jgi:hypothetical protein
MLYPQFFFVNKNDFWSATTKLSKDCCVPLLNIFFDMLEKRIQPVDVKRNPKGEANMADNSGMHGGANDPPSVKTLLPLSGHTQ